MISLKSKYLFLLINFLISLSLIATTQRSAKAQRAMSLTQMDCSSISAESGVDAWVVVDSEVVIGREFFTAVAVLRYGWEFLGSNYIPSNRTAAVACRITPSGARPRFRTLRLAFGMQAGNSYTDDADLIRLNVFVDGNQVNSQEVTRWEPGYMAINVANARTVSLEATCLSRQSNTCPSLVFVQTLLEQ